VLSQMPPIYEMASNHESISGRFDSVFSPLVWLI
jgi:hypothetical protein